MRSGHITDLSPKCSTQEHSSRTDAPPRTSLTEHQLGGETGAGCEQQRDPQDELNWVRLELSGGAATQTGEAQKLRLSRASESWLMSRQYGSRCRMKSTL